MRWRDLGRAVTRRRVELGLDTIAAFARVVGLSTRILGDIEGGRRESYDPATLAKLEQALRWEPDYIRRTFDDDSEPLPPLDDRPMPPIAVKVAWLVGDDSPLSERDRRMLEAVVARVLEPFWPPTITDE